MAMTVGKIAVGVAAGLVLFIVVIVVIFGLLIGEGERLRQKASSATSDSRDPTSDTHDTSTSVPTTAWMLSEKVSPIDDSRTVYISREATNPIKTWLSSETPVLTIVCSAKPAVYVDIKTSASIEGFDSDNTHLVRVRLDNGKPSVQHWRDSLDKRALFAPDARGLEKRMAASKQMPLEFTPFNTPSQQTASFALEGLEPMLKAEKLCRYAVKAPN
jgi:hypothetical protein